MIKAVWLLINPASAWESIFQSQRKVASTFFLYLLPMLLLASAAEGYGLHHWGKWRGEVARLYRFSTGHALLFEVGQGMVLLGTIFLAVRLVKAVGETFHGRHTFTEAFICVAYALGPYFMIKCCDAFVFVSPWLTWAIGITLTMMVLYQGLPIIMKPDPPHAFGLYFMSSLLLFLITGLVRFVTSWYLQGKFPNLEQHVTELAARLHLQ